jgi:hypothetical protein
MTKNEKFRLVLDLLHIATQILLISIILFKIIL